MNKVKMVMLVGLPASGKSTYAKELADKNNMVVLSSDELRKELYGDINDMEHNENVFEELHRRLKVNLSNGKSVIFDATNLASKKRMNTLKKLDKIDCIKECHIIATPISECMKHDQRRDRSVGVNVINKMYMNFNTPYYFEGWDDIKIVYLKEEYKHTYKINDTFERINRFNQGNIHHTLTLGYHCLMARSFYKGDNTDMIHAITLHDIGKEFTKTYGEDGQYHYFSHQNVGAYDVLNYDIDGDKLLVSILINLHMRMFDDMYVKKYRNLWGESLFNKLFELHYCDEKAR